MYINIYDHNANIHNYYLSSSLSSSSSSSSSYIVIIILLSNDFYYFVQSSYEIIPEKSSFTIQPNFPQFTSSIKMRSDGDTPFKVHRVLQTIVKYYCDKLFGQYSIRNFQKTNGKTVLTAACFRSAVQPPLIGNGSSLIRFALVGRAGNG